MKIFDATPPADFPDQVVIAQDNEFSQRNPDHAYWLRVKGEGVHVEAYPLTGAVGHGHARQMAVAMGFNPSHWTLPGDSRPYRY